MEVFKDQICKGPFISIEMDVFKDQICVEKGAQGYLKDYPIWKAGCTYSIDFEARESTW